MVSKPPSCVGCPYYNLDGPVWGRGSTNAKLATVAQNPWKDEWNFYDENGRGMPLAGASGRVYNRNAELAGIDREREFTTNVVKCCVPPGTRLDPLAVAKCRPLLEKELSLLHRCHTILTLGQEAFNYLTGKELSIVHTRAKFGSRTSKATTNNQKGWLRGAVYSGAQIGERIYTIIPAAHPSYIMRTGFREAPILLADFQKAKRWAEGGGVKFEEHFNYSPSTSEIFDYLDHACDVGILGLDIETPYKQTIEDEEELVFQGFADRVDVLGLSTAIGEVVGIGTEYISLFQRLAERPHPPITVFTFNGGFDFGHLAATLGYRTMQEFQTKLGLRHADVMLGLNCLYSDLRPKDLAMAMSLFTDMPYTKNLHLTDPDRYNASDTHGTLWAGLTMLERLKEVPAYARN